MPTDRIIQPRARPDQLLPCGRDGERRCRSYRVVHSTSSAASADSIRSEDVRSAAKKAANMMFRKLRDLRSPKHVVGFLLQETTRGVRTEDGEKATYWFVALQRDIANPYTVRRGDVEVTFRKKVDVTHAASHAEYMKLLDALTSKYRDGHKPSPVTVKHPKRASRSPKTP